MRLLCISWVKPLPSGLWTQPPEEATLDTVRRRWRCCQTPPPHPHREKETRIREQREVNASNAITKSDGRWGGGKWNKPLPRASHRWGRPSPTSPLPGCSYRLSGPRGPKTQESHRRWRFGPRGLYLQKWSQNNHAFHKSVKSHCKL